MSLVKKILSILKKEKYTLPRLVPQAGNPSYLGRSWFKVNLGKKLLRP
jgi:hypothetical protein